MTKSIKNNQHKHLILYACCLLVTGKSRSLICDVQRDQIFFVPNSLVIIIEQFVNKSLKQILTEYDGKEKKIICEYIDFLLKNDLGFFVNKTEIANYPPISMEWMSPAKITNAIVEIKDDSSYLFDIQTQLENLGCKAIQIIFYTDKNVAELDLILGVFSNSVIRHIELVLRENEYLTDKILEELAYRHKRLNFICIHSCSKENTYEFSRSKTVVHRIEKTVESGLSCGIVERKDFFINIDNFTESQRHNTCLNRKISIDTQGAIKNCPSMHKNYGNIKDTTLQEAIEKPGFKDLWYIHKDQIAVCKDCEFRHVCTDCRAYLENPHDIYSKPLKCGYNPYTCEWEDWSTNKLKQQAIDFYGLRELI